MNLAGRAGQVHSHLPCTQPSGPQLWPQEDLSVPSVSQDLGPTGLCIQMPCGRKGGWPCALWASRLHWGPWDPLPEESWDPGAFLHPPTPMDTPPSGPLGAEGQAPMHRGRSRSSDCTPSAPEPSWGRTAGSAPGTPRPEAHGWGTTAQPTAGTSGSRVSPTHHAPQPHQPLRS